MKKLLCIICLLAAVLFVDTASACSGNRCGGYYGRSSYSRSFRGYGHRSFRGYGHRGYRMSHRGYGRRGFRGGYSHRGYGRRGYGRRSYGHRYW